MNIIRNLAILVFLAILIVSCKSTQPASSSETRFTPEQEALIMAADTDTPMRVFKITSKDDSILLRTASQGILVDPDDEALQTFIQRLHRTVTDSMSLGVGIAAPQVGILKNIIWVQRLDKDNLPWEVYLNPSIVQYSEKKQDCLEGCLSIPNRRDTTRTRAYAILVEYDLPDKTHKMEMVEAFTAVIFQHEIDHLNGILYLDHLKKEVRDAQKNKH